MARRAAGSLLAGHAGLTWASASYAYLAHTPVTSPPTNNQDQNQNENSPCLSCNRAHQLQKVVAKAYRGAGLDAPVCADDITFEDPLVKCSGKEEVHKCFRALKLCSPEQLQPPVARAGNHSGVTEVMLYQRYFGVYDVKSILVVNTGPNGLITSLEERWNGTNLLHSPPFQWSRRLNGLICKFICNVIL